MARKGWRALDQRIYVEDEDDSGGDSEKEEKKIVTSRFVQKLLTIVQDIQKASVEITEEHSKRRGR